MDDRIKSVMANIFDIPADAITEDTSIDNIEAWDSIHHLNLVMSLEQEFGIVFSEEQIVEMLNYPLIVEAIREVKSQLG